jgi:hypothetical protein
MKISRWFCAAVTLAALSPLAAQQAESAFSLSLTVEPETVRPGSDITIVIVATNKTQQRVPFPIDRYNPWVGYIINVTDPAGEPAGKTKLYRTSTGDKTGKDAPGPEPGLLPANIILGASLAPGAKLEQRIILNRKNNELIDLSRLGKYTVQVERTDDVTKTTVKSNVATFAITN